MTDQIVTCPNCGHEFELGQALTDRISGAIRAEMESQAREREKRLAAEVQRKVKEETGLELQAVRDELREKSEKLVAAGKKEIELLRRERQLKEQQEEQELELLRRMDEERKKIFESAKDQAAEQQRLKLRERENLIQSLRDQVGDLQRRIEVGSQESQGEALEGQLIGSLRQRFPFDEIEDIKKGQKGADILQRVRNKAGKACGTIVWESKNTKGYSKDWIDKLKKDQQEAGADLAVLMTMALPPDVKDFDCLQDVWVTNFQSALSLCGVLRELLIGVERAKVVSTLQEGMKDLVYRYVTGQEFTQRVKMIATAYRQLQIDLESEKRAMLGIWKKREKQISTVLDNLAGMRGELEGLLLGEAAVLPGIEVLSLAGIAADHGDDDVDS
jgi:hypothetical protein